MPADPHKIAVVLPNHLGDVAMATPALRSLREGFPRARLTALVRRELAPLLGGAPWLDRLLAHDVYGVRGLARLRRRLALARELRGEDVVLVLPNSFSSALLAFLSRAPRRVGYRRRGRGALLTEALAVRRQAGRFVPVAMERYYLDLARALGALDTGTRLELFVEPEAERACDALLRAHGIDAAARLVCIAPGAGYGPSKLWPAAYFAQLARDLEAEGAQVALVHGPGEEALAESIVAGAGPRIASLGGAGMTLSLLKSVIRRAALVVCNDAGARHVAAAFGVRAIVLMGPTAVSYTNLNLERTKLLREPVPCSPCQLKVCPIDHRCMTRLVPGRVLDEARRALGEREWRGSVELELRA